MASVAVIGVPLDLGAGRRGVDMGPSAIRYARLHEELAALGHEVVDLGDLEVPKVHHFVAQRRQLLVKPGVADGAGAHVHPAPPRAEVKGDADHRNGGHEPILQSPKRALAKAILSHPKA